MNTIMRVTAWVGLAICLMMSIASAEKDETGLAFICFLAALCAAALLIDNDNNNEYGI